MMIYSRSMKPPLKLKHLKSYQNLMQWYLSVFSLTHFIPEQTKWKGARQWLLSYINTSILNEYRYATVCIVFFIFLILCVTTMYAGNNFNTFYIVNLMHETWSIKDTNIKINIIVMLWVILFPSNNCKVKPKLTCDNCRIKHFCVNYIWKQHPKIQHIC